MKAEEKEMEEREEEKEMGRKRNIKFLMNILYFIWLTHENKQWHGSAHIQIQDPQAQTSLVFMDELSLNLFLYRMKV